VTDFAHSAFAAEARVRKAVRIEAALRMAGLDAAAAKGLDEAGRRGMERAAGVRRSSDETWAAALRLMDSFRPGQQQWDGCPVDGEQQGDPGICHNCGSVIYHAAVKGPMRFCSQICVEAHHTWHLRGAPQG